MKIKLKYIFPLIFLTACTGKNKTETSPAPLYPQPQTFQVNTENGYALNTATGDTIKTIVLGNGDTLITGVPIPANGKTIHPDSVSQPTVVTLSKPDSSINAHPNVHKIPDNLTVIPVNQDSLTIILLKEIDKNDTAHYLVNATGDTIKTGIPIPTQGKIVPVTQPQPIKALHPRYKDATTNNLQYLDVDQGMASSNVMSSLEDKHGNIWFGTNGGGVSKYDGESFTHFTENEGLLSNVVSSIIEDKRGNIWFGSWTGGICMYDGESFTHFTEKEGLSINIVWTIKEDSQGNLWFGMWGKGVIKYDGKSFTHFTEKEGLSNNFVRSILEDRHGNLWFGTDGGVNVYDGKSFTHFTTREGLSNNMVWSILEDKYGNMWFGTYGGGVNKYDGETITHYTENEGLSNNIVWSITEDKQANLWFSTSRGVNKYDRESFTHYTENEGLSGNNVWSIMEDTNGNLWFATSDGGVSLIVGGSFVHFTENEGLSGAPVWSIIEDTQGRYWFGTYGDGIRMYDGKTTTHFTEKEGLSYNKVSSILEDSKGNIWFGTAGRGVNLFDGETFTHFTDKEGLISNYVFSIVEDKHKNIWFGTNAGVSMYDGQSFTNFTDKEGLSNNYLLSIMEDTQGNLWFGTDGGGVSKYNGESFTHFTEKEGLSNNAVTCIMEDRNGNLWFGTTGGGVCKYNGESFTHFTEKEGLSSNRISSIMEDMNGNIWVSSESGLTEIVFGLADASLYTYLKNDGLKGEFFSSNSVCLDSKNHIWWGSNKSLTSLDLNKFNIAQNPPVVYLRQLNINEQFIDYRDNANNLANEIDFNEVQAFENYPLNLELPYHKNHLTFHFSAIDWGAPHKIEYSYIIDGLNTSWSKPNHEAKADYRNLPYGNFTFKVCAIGESGKWSEAFEYEFTIHPPWWHTWWARLLYALTGLFIIILAVKWRTVKLSERQKELETEVDTATKEIRDQKEEVVKQKEQVEEAHKEITDSINYAERIQRSFLATKELLDENLNEYFVFFQPKDIVSGDFYWAEKLNNGTFAMVNADSTGHGVPGAIMSILNISSIEEAVKEGLTAPHEIFNKTRQFIIDRLKKDGSLAGGKDGMDASIICFDLEKNKFKYTAAQNPIWVIRKGELIEIKPEKMPIGKHDKDNIPFVGGEFEIQQGDQVYTLTDGFQDQFGGPKGKKFMVKKVREYILSISHLSMKEQHQKIKEVFTKWMGDLEQVDDVCVIGVKI